MATRFLAWMALGLAVTAGCHTTPRNGRPLAMMPAAPIDDKPRGNADGPPRGKPGDGLAAADVSKPRGLSTAAELAKRHDGSEEATYEVPVPPPPKETFSAPAVDLPPAPTSVQVTPTPAGLPPPLETKPAPPPTQLAPPPMMTPLAAPTTPSPFSLPSPPAAPASPTVAPQAAPPAIAPAAPNAPALAPPVGVVPASFDLKPAPNPAPKLSATRTPTTPGDDNIAQLRVLYDKANARVSQMDTYTMRIRRREVVAGKQRPEELIIGKFRTAPFSVYMKWIGDEAKNREMCYVQGRHEDVIHTLLAPGELIVMGGKHIKWKPDHPLVRSNSRYPITSAGLGPTVASFGRIVTALENGETKEGSARYLGKLKRPEFEDQVEGVLQSLPPKCDPLLPSGGQRFWYFDAKESLPVLLVTMDHQGREVEYYCHDRIQGPAGLDDDHFNPYRLWKTASK